MILHPSHPTGHPADRPNRPPNAIRHDGCLECGTGFYGRPEAEFCCDKCRAGWNSRRAKRGAELYDLAMSWRVAGLAGALTLVCRAITRFRAEDVRDRAGRRSWAKLSAVIARKPSLKAVVMNKGRPT